ncbi:methylated-DNA--protein-cysteine methyltransferase [Frondihabitans sucicola]|uniref:Methylated-DNA--protein-cysteine methyltransferase n=1 Tax=Frondihabitans sucicola TaxID=1268041 RepID=A0ABM8GRE5_9MICO|nr:methylated-DNA--[protein]-cysteine S-methyltransferase [Frondihabitans sucicola]BDZ51033.1 methylated-DNA--protein-cysteine methyltransferase [Frondihabitans sucicola]
MTSTIAPLIAQTDEADRRPTLFPAAVSHYESPLGRIEIRTRFDSIVRLDIESDGHLPCDDLDEAPTPVHDEARRQLDAYFAGRRRTFDLPLEQLGTPFQDEIWERLRDVPWGTATSYGELAVLADRPTGARAVGGAIRANRIALLVPCHRVLGAGRRITGYSPGRGVETKRWLLEHEGIDFVE